MNNVYINLLICFKLILYTKIKFFCVYECYWNVIENKENV